MATETKARKPKARATDTVLGVMDERLQMIEREIAFIDPVSDFVKGNLESHAGRMRELCDELRRSLNAKNGTEDSE